MLAHVHGAIAVRNVHKEHARKLDSVLAVVTKDGDVLWHDRCERRALEHPVVIEAKGVERKRFVDVLVHDDLDALGAAAFRHAPKRRPARKMYNESAEATRLFSGHVLRLLLLTRGPP